MFTHSAELLTNGAATGAAFQWPGGRLSFSASATWGGGSATLEFLGPDATTWIPAVKDTDGTAAALSADGMLICELPPCQIRVAIVTATAVYARADRIPY